VDVETALGRGTVFRLVLLTGSLSGVAMIEHLSEGGVSVAPKTDEACRTRALPASCKILLAEDGIDNQVLIKKYLTTAGATVTVVADGLAAVDAVNAQPSGDPFSVVLMDMQMPELDGYGAIAKLRHLGYQLPIVALTAHAMAGDREQCERAGCDDFLTKPVDRRRLIETVARFLDLSTDAASRVPSISPLISELQDVDVRDIVVQFVGELATRSAAIVEAEKAGDKGGLRRLAHQLKGAAGGYGFPLITEAAADVERAVQEEPAAALHKAIDRLASLCHRARAAGEMRDGSRETRSSGEMNTARLQRSSDRR
jgi:CheY-like chemotaxis protein/HPt (histidine-containing phosphotransfer) domain-containing protein